MVDNGLRNAGTTTSGIAYWTARQHSESPNRVGYRGVAFSDTQDARELIP